MKKILVLTANYPNETNIYNGIFVKDQAKALSKKYTVTVLVIFNDLKKFDLIPKVQIKQSIDEMLNITEVHISKSIPIINQLFYLLISAFYCIQLAKKERINLIHAHFTYPSAVIAYITKFFIKVPFVLTEHYGIFENYFRSPIHKYLSIKSVNHADEIITVSYKSKDRIQMYCSKEIKVVHNFVNTEKYSLSKKRKNSVVQIGFMGGLNTNIKGLDILLKALTDVSDPFHLHIAGGGSLYEYYVNLTHKLGLSDKVTFYGIVNPNQTKDFFHQLDLFILCSRRESFGIVLIEALSCGIPVIGSKCGGPEEIIKSDNGYLFENENIEDLKDTLIQFFSHSDDFDHLKIRDYAIKHFSEETYINRMSQIIDKII